MIDLKQHNFPYDSFVGGWYIPEHICDGMLDYYYQKSNDITPGVVGNLEDDNDPVKPDVKDSLDLFVQPNDSSSECKAYISYLMSCFENYVNYYEYANKVCEYGLNVGYNIQRYKKGGGFKRWHFERSHLTSMSRVLVFMTYLNDVEDGGTEFLHQKLKIPAIKGLTLFWPADWTHTHKGIITNDDEKMIATGWFDAVDVRKWKDEFIKS